MKKLLLLAIFTTFTLFGFQKMPNCIYAQTQKELDSIQQAIEIEERTLPIYEPKKVSFEKLEKEWTTIGKNQQGKLNFIANHKYDLYEIGLEATLTKIEDAEDIFVTKKEGVKKFLWLKSKAEACYELAIESMHRIIVLYIMEDGKDTVSEADYTEANKRIKDKAYPIYIDKASVFMALQSLWKATGKNQQKKLDFISNYKLKLYDIGLRIPLGSIKQTQKVLITQEEHFASILVTQSRQQAIKELADEYNKRQ